MTMTAMTEAALLTRLGDFPSAGRLGECLEEFLTSHGFHDAAPLVGRRLQLCAAEGCWDDGCCGDAEPNAGMIQDERAIAYAEAYIP